MAKKDRNGLHFGIHLTRFAWYARKKKFPGALYVHIVEEVAEDLRKKTGYPLASVRKWLVEGDVRGAHPLTKKMPLQY